MAKIEIIKSEIIGELKIFASAMIFVAFKKQYGKSLEAQLQDDPSDLEPLAFIILKAYESACKISNEDPKHDLESILNIFSLEDLTKGINLLFPVNRVESKDEKKTIQKVK